jgi:hypothetical protein
MFPMRGMPGGILMQRADKVISGAGERCSPVRHIDSAFVPALLLHANLDLRDNQARQHRHITDETVLRVIPGDNPDFFAILVAGGED